MTNIKDIKDLSPNKETIDTLEAALKQAKSGKLRSVLMIKGWSDDCCSHAWSIDQRNGRRPLLAELVMAQHDYTVYLSILENDTILSGALADD